MSDTDHSDSKTWVWLAVPRGANVTHLGMLIAKKKYFFNKVVLVVVVVVAVVVFLKKWGLRKHFGNSPNGEPLIIKANIEKL